MRYSKDHKHETHRRIVAKAEVRLREKGLHGIGVADLMKEAGLTHGGFYAHFDSREALVIEAITHAMESGAAKWRRAGDGDESADRFATMVEAYLSPQHRDAPGQGCAVPSLGADILREGGKTKRAFAAKVEDMAAAIADRMGEGTSPRHARAAMATLVGSLLLSRLTSGEVSDDFLAAGREAILARRKPQDALAAPKEPTPSKGARRTRG